MNKSAAHNQEDNNESTHLSLSKIFDLMENEAFYSAREKSGESADKSGKLTVPDFSFSLEDVLFECSDLPIADMNPAEALNYSVLSNHKTLWFEGNKFFLAPVPFIEGGYGKESLSPAEWQKFIDSKLFLRPLSVYGKDNLTANFGRYPHYYFDLYPEELRKDIEEGGCSFEIKYSNPHIFSDPADAEWFRKKYLKAISNLKKLFSGAPSHKKSGSIH